MNTEYAQLRQSAWNNSILPESVHHGRHHDALVGGESVVDTFSRAWSYLTENRLSTSLDIIIACICTALLTVVLLTWLRPPMCCVRKSNDWEEGKLSAVRILVYTILATGTTATVLIVRNYV